MGRKSLGFISALLAATALLSGCAGDESTSVPVPPSDKPLYEWGTITGETLTVWGEANDLSRPYITRAFANYEKATGNTVNVVPLTRAELDVKVPIAFSQPGAEQPDIYLGYGGTNIEFLNPDESFYDFTDAPWVEDLTDTALNQAIYNAKVIGLPYGEASISGTLYNKEIFQKYNLTLPTTQDEFWAVCETLLQQGITPMYLPYAEITMLLYQFPMDSVMQDSDVLDALNSGALSYSQMPEMRKIIDWYKTMSDKGYFGADYTQNNWDGMDGAMRNGQYAMMLCWDTWLYTNFTGDTEQIGIMPAFIGTPENGCFEGPNVLLAMVNQKSPKLAPVLDLINFMADPYNYNVSYAGLYTAPMFKNQVGSITTPQYMEMERRIDRLFYDSTTWSRVRGFSQMDARYIQDYMQNKCSAEECLAAMDAARISRAGIAP